MKIALIGYGKMGKELEIAALTNGHEIVLKADHNSKITSADLKQADVAIEFTQPGAAVKNIQLCFDANIPVVVGTTGWYDDLEKIREECKSKNQSLLFASNFSIGVNIFFELNRKLAKMMNDYKEYEVDIEEVHHLQKLDKPSGTAISLANDLVNELDSKTSWQLDEEDNYPKEKLLIRSYREDAIPGIHSVAYRSTNDVIEIKHVAQNRKGFAMGALIAAEWLVGKKGVFTMKDVLFQQ